MDAVVLHGSLDQSLSPYKSHFRNPRNIQHPLILRPFEHFPANGLVPAQLPYRFQSYPPYSLPQPPLLPLPATTLRRSATMYPPVTKKVPSNGHRARESSLTPKKSKYAKKEEKKSPKKAINAKPLGPDPKELPKDVLSTFMSSSSPKQEADVFSGSAAFTISPPPSSVPLPTFFLRPKAVMSCKVEAVAGIDTGATDDLRRLLRLR